MQLCSVDAIVWQTQQQGQKSSSDRAPPARLRRPFWGLLDRIVRRDDGTPCGRSQRLKRAALSRSGRHHTNAQQIRRKHEACSCRRRGRRLAARRSRRGGASSLTVAYRRPARPQPQHEHAGLRCSPPRSRVDLENRRSSFEQKPLTLSSTRTTPTLWHSSKDTTARTEDARTSPSSRNGFGARGAREARSAPSAGAESSVSPRPPGRRQIQALRRLGAINSIS